MTPATLLSWVVLIHFPGYSRIGALVSRDTPLTDEGVFVSNTPMGQSPRSLKEIIHQAIYDALVENNFNRAHTARQLQCAGKTIRNYISRFRAEGIIIPHSFTTHTRHATKSIEPIEPTKPPARIDLRPPHTRYCARCGRIKLTILTHADGACEKCVDRAEGTVLYCSSCGQISSAPLIKRGYHALCGGCSLDKPHAG